MSKRPLILVTNDDGITAPGIASLIEVAKTFGDVLIVAPDSPQSGMGHAITLTVPITYKQNNIFKDCKSYSCSGTPVDCVKMAMHILGDVKPDLVLSGVNHGANYATNVLYSGTMSAAIEGSLQGIPSVGFSLLDFDIDADFRGSQKIIKMIVAGMLNNELSPEICLNVNIPQLKADDVKGIKICRQARAFWKDGMDERTSPFGKKYHWLTGNFENNDGGQDTDIWALENGYASVVPTQYDLTAHHAIATLNSWSING